MSRNFRIVQFSDLHLTEKDNGPRSEPKLFGKLRGMNDAFIRLAGSRIAGEADVREFRGGIPGTLYLSFAFGPGFLGLSGRSSSRSSLSIAVPAFQ